MNKFTVLLSSQAKKYYKKVNKKTQDLLRDCFLYLEENPFYHPGGIIKRIRGQSLYRFRAGDLRIIYEINELKREIPIHLIGPRGDIYKKI
ncbi:MAG: type II toxin-antitoxin system RelE/ParE family toxin [Elusimicrobiota bacterium]